MKESKLDQYVCHHSTAILMAVFDGAQYIEEQMQSLLNQTDQNWELFIHDDGSTDQTLSIVKEYVEKYPDRIHIVEGKGTGGSRNNFLYLMHCVKAANYMFCDQDDIWLPEKIQKTSAKMRELSLKYPNKPLMVFTDLKVVDEDLQVISEKMSDFQNLKMDHTSFRDLMVCNVVTGCTVMINRKCLVMSRECADVNAMIMHDWWCALVASYFGVVEAVEESLILYRQHDTNSVGAKNIHSGKYIRNAINHGENQRENIRKTERQAGCFADTFHLNDPVITDYRNLDSYNKLKKLRIICRHGFRKSGVARTLGLLYYC